MVAVSSWAMLGQLRAQSLTLEISLRLGLKILKPATKVKTLLPSSVYVSIEFHSQFGFDYQPVREVNSQSLTTFSHGFFKIPPDSILVLEIAPK